jgi:AraC family transcriptional regulator
MESTAAAARAAAVRTWFQAVQAIGRMQFPPMSVAEVEVRGSIELEQRALDLLFGSWLPSSGYLPSDQPCFEAWIGRPFEHGYEHFELHAHLPLRQG